MKNEQIYILGNCALDNRETYFETADFLYNLMQGKKWILKASYDKANRTSLKGGRGLGLSECVEIFKEVKQKYPDIVLTTDVHEADEVEKLVGVIDVIQIPAFLSRQTSLVVECAKHFNIVNIKKMISLGFHNVNKSADKVKNTNPNCKVWLTDRGTNFGYQHLFVDFTSTKEYNKAYDRVILDCTHSTQRSRQIYGKQGDPELAKKYFLIAKTMGYDGVFAEVHPRPWESVSDGDCMIRLKDFPAIFTKKQKIDLAND